MQTTLLSRFVLILLPGVGILALAALGLIEMPIFDGLTRATIALTIMAYMMGMLAMLWAMGPALKRLASDAVTDASR
ncbi:MAG: hypothetical protein E6R08_01165 [Nevskiaceae bacterium]|nr:MAG: hypothetical protein E6R08_01165 [Nevskiaceae bacterium]